ncbi:stringent starvation protein B [Candidatus Kinetoplastibacterium blastocrithidii TCC012E]|uniref:Stringent starvation protein B n=1 Tax=Candidatus Kinetoplastidibacterium blastocrithidiae TCC012E TaxID=1208922 RepID=M1MCD7_9PROT|nr:ClpXP protease specificity-enhancing factor SspB [Candidatus Kinetoplastibacterium blastocrithidii]AFZ83367.1 stringent starvation protein B [Candidatus Kinetoplastibacterium blastocrithidii (ex Strigomonas culicis)]AGF49465.1 stringent starvation protein B [Candidatus Kinetoplastibacterium blastocrithidii TCC012E]
MQSNSTKPYLIRALHEWCTDNNYEPYILVKTDDTTIVPRLYIKNGEITLNISIDATAKLQIKNDAITFQANFNNTIENIFIPMANIIAIYSPVTGIGMEFTFSKANNDSNLENIKSKQFSIVK